MPEVSMLRTLVSQALADLAMIARTDGYHPGEVFYVERYFLHSQLESDTARLSITDNGLGNFNAGGTCTCCRDIIVKAYRHGATEPSHTYVFSYFKGEGGDFGPGHGLVITENGNMPYWRDVGQKPETEWLLNEMANNLTDTNGRYVFKGEPCNI